MKRKSWFFRVLFGAGVFATSAFGMARGDVITWVGTSSTNWMDVANWRDAGGVMRVPCATDRVVIAGDTAFRPVLSGGEHVFNVLTVESGASLFLFGSSVTVTNALTVAGNLELMLGDAAHPALVVKGDADLSTGQLDAPVGTVTLTGGADQTFASGNGAISLFEIAKTGGTVAFPCGLAASRFTALAPGVTVAVAPGRTLESSYFNCRGVTLKSMTDGETWFVAPMDVQSFCDVTVSDSTSTEGVAYANAASTDAGRNVNWEFGPDRAFFTGAAGTGDFATPGNWSGGKVPDANTLAFIVPGAGLAYDVRATVPVCVSNLVIGTGAGRASFSTDRKLTLGGDLEVGAHATVTLDLGNEDNVVGGNVIVRTGGVMTHSKMMADNPGTTGDHEWLHAGKNWDAPRFAGYARFRLAVGGSFTLEPGAAVDVANKGYAGALGPMFAAVNSGRSTAGHASRGFNTEAGPNYDPTNFMLHDSICNPNEHGSGGQWNDGSAHGGGVVRIVAGGDITVDGDILADAVSANASYRGAGGSIRLVAGGTFSGAGRISAKGGDVVSASDPVHTPTTAFGPGGGGIIAVEAGRNAFTGTMNASGGQTGYEYGDTALALIAGGGYRSIYDRTIGRRDVIAAMDIDRFTGWRGEGAQSEPGSYSRCQWPVYFQRVSTPFPAGADLLALTNGADAAVARAYRQIRLTIGALTVIDLQCDVTIDDLDFIDGIHEIKVGTGAQMTTEQVVTSKIRLNGHRLTVKSSKHMHGQGWAAAPKKPPLAYSLHVEPGEDAEGNPGEIVWVPGATRIRIQ